MFVLTFTFYRDRSLLLCVTAFRFRAPIPTPFVPLKKGRGRPRSGGLVTGSVATNLRRPSSLHLLLPL